MSIPVFPLILFILFVGLVIMVCYEAYCERKICEADPKAYYEHKRWLRERQDKE